MLNKRVLRFLKTQKVKPHSRVLVGFSGGPDSTCLLAILSDIASSLTLDLSAAYLDHGLRPDAERARELAHVRTVCDRFAVPLQVHAIAPGQLAAAAGEKKISLEEAARCERYAFFKRLKIGQGFHYLCLAHQLDDQIETVLARLFEGSGPGGLKGIPEKNGWILRPLLGTSRAEIRAFLAEKGLEGFLDSTNASGRFKRNRVRRELIPLLGEIFPGLGRSLLSLSRKSKLVADYLACQTADLLAWKQIEQGVAIDRETFFSAPAAIRMESLFSQYSRVIDPESRRQKKSLPFRFIRPLLNPGGSYEGILPLAGFGIVIRTEHDSLFLERDIVSKKKIGYFIHVEPGVPFTLCGLSCILRLMTLDDNPADALCAFDAPSVFPPIVIRSWKPGDRIFLGFGNKKLKKLFVDLKLSQEEKDNIPLVADERGVLAVVGKACGYRNFIRQGAAAAPCNKAGTALVLLRYGEA